MSEARDSRDERGDGTGGRGEPPGGAGPAGDGVELDEVDLRDLVRAAMRPPVGSVAPPLLRGVQRKLRVRSRGKFYGDGWSTARSPRSTYLVTSLVMLALLAFAAIVLVPWASGGLP